MMGSSGIGNASTLRRNPPKLNATTGGFSPGTLAM
jgi:hypothetical protein